MVIRQGRVGLDGRLGHIDEHVNVVVITSHILVLDKPLELLLDHLLRRQKHILKYIDKFRLQMG